MTTGFSKDNFISYCELLAAKDVHLKEIINQYGYPPCWSRTPSFTTLIYIILEQQVSLAAAKAAFLKLEAAIDHITPEKILQLTVAEMKACYFSRQKTIYARQLSEAVLNGQLQVEVLTEMSDDDVRTTMKKIKGIGDWTVDVFLMMALHRFDCFPTGDIALIKSIKEVKLLPLHSTKETILAVAEQWRPYRTIAAFLLWHAYLEKRKKPNQ